MNHAAIAAARRFMTGEASPLELGAEVCASCGVDRATERVARAMNATFNQTAFLVHDSVHICHACLGLFQDKTTRSKVLYFPEPGKKVFLEREEVLPLLADPPDKPFVLCLPYSFQKHSFFYAGVSTSACAWIGTDDRVVKLDYAAYDIPGAIALVGEMLKNGVPRKELQNGSYSIFSRAKFGQRLDDWEAALAPLRQDGAIELMVIYSPATKEKIKFAMEDEVAFTDTESKAIDLLVDLAWASSYRKSDGMAFWGGFFRRRINRNLRKGDLKIFFSSVAGDISCESPALETSVIEALDDDMAALVLKDIQTKTELLLAAAYTRLKAR